MVISDATATARFSQASVEQARIAATMDRLAAQLAGNEVLTFPSLEGLGAQPALRATERRVFGDQRAALEGERALIRARITRLEHEAQALDVRRAGKAREIAALRDEEAVQAEALTERIGNISRVNALARLIVIAETEALNLDEEESVIERAVQEAQLELLQIDPRHRAQLSPEQADISAERALLTEELSALGDRIRRNAVIAPVDGVVIDLAYTSVDAIVAPGEAIFQLAPSEASFEVEVRFAPQDRDDLALRRADDFGGAGNRPAILRRSAAICVKPAVCGKGRWGGARGPARIPWSEPFRGAGVFMGGDISHDAPAQMVQPGHHIGFGHPQADRDLAEQRRDQPGHDPCPKADRNTGQLHNDTDFAMLERIHALLYAEVTAARRAGFHHTHHDQPIAARTQKEWQELVFVEFPLLDEFVHNVARHRRAQSDEKHLPRHVHIEARCTRCVAP